MTTPSFGDPFSTGAADRRLAALEARMSAIEARPRVKIPAPLVPRPVNALPSTDLYMPVTSATFIEVWEHIVPRWTGLGAWLQVPYRTGAGTTGDVRLRNASGATSGAAPVLAASSGVLTFQWLHNQPIWSGDVVWVEARRTAGANLVELGHPSAAMVDPESCTLTGF